MSKIRKQLKRYGRCQTVNEDSPLTEQSHKDRCDINQIIKRFARTGSINHYAKNQGIYDTLPAEDLLSAQILIQRGEQSFNELPAEVRKEFDHDPVKFLTFMQDPANKTEWSRLGLQGEKQKPDATINDLIDAVKNLAPASGASSPGAETEPTPPA